jgi:hypothetical protein
VGADVPEHTVCAAAGDEAEAPEGRVRALLQREKLCLQLRPTYQRRPCARTASRSPVVPYAPRRAAGLARKSRVVTVLAVRRARMTSS